MVGEAFKTTAQKQSVPVLVIRSHGDPDTVIERLEFDTVAQFQYHLATQQQPQDGYYDLSGQDLSGMDISFARLNNADLRNTNLSNTQLVQASLNGAKLQGADCSGSNFQQAEMVGVTLSPEKGKKALPAELNHANFSYAHLAGAKMARVNARNASFEAAIMAEADCRNGDFTNATLSYAEAEGANFSNAVLDHTALCGMGLKKADLTDTTMHGANIDGADMTLTHVKWQTLQQCIGHAKNDPRTNARLLAPHRRKRKTPKPVG